MSKTIKFEEHKSAPRIGRRALDASARLEMAAPLLGRFIAPAMAAARSLVDHAAGERVAAHVSRTRLRGLRRVVFVEAVAQPRRAAVGAVAVGRPVPHPGVLPNRCQQQAVPVHRPATAVALAVIVPCLHALPASRDVPPTDLGVKIK